jgi:hypothetical protein
MVTATHRNIAADRGIWAGRRRQRYECRKSIIPLARRAAPPPVVAAVVTPSAI